MAAFSSDEGGSTQTNVVGERDASAPRTCALNASRTSASANDRAAPTTSTATRSVALAGAGGGGTTGHETPGARLAGVDAARSAGYRVSQ